MTALPLGMTQAVRNTVYNTEGLEEHKVAIRRLLPETWTHINNVNFLAFHFQLKLLGVDFRSDTEVAVCLAKFEKEKLLLRDGMLIRRGN